jgi:hypothetical protein
MSKFKKLLSSGGFFPVFIFVYSIIQIFQLIFNLVFSDGAKAWEYLGKSVASIFLGLIVWGLTKYTTTSSLKKDPF